MMRIQLMLMMVLIAGTHAESLPAEAAELKARKDAKIREIEALYLGELSKLRDRYLAGGETEKAAAISAALGQSKVEKKDPLTSLVGTWRRDTDGGVWTIPNTQGGVFNGKLSFTMKYDDDKKRIIVVGHDWIDHLTITSNPDVVYGVADHRGRKTRYRLDRVK